MIVIGLGANLSDPRYGGPQDACEAALDALRAAGVAVLRRSRWYRSAPVPASDQPWFVNAVAEVVTDLSAAELLDLLHRIEREMGRERRSDTNCDHPGRGVTPCGSRSGTPQPVHSAVSPGGNRSGVEVRQEVVPQRRG